MSANPYYNDALVAIRKRFVNAIESDREVVWNVSDFDHKDGHSLSVIHWSAHPSGNSDNINVPNTKMYLWYEPSMVSAWVSYEKFLKLVVAFVFKDKREKVNILILDFEKRKEQKFAGFINNFNTERNYRINIDRLGLNHSVDYMLALADAHSESGAQISPPQESSKDSSLEEPKDFDIAAIRASAVAEIHKSIRERICENKLYFKAECEVAGSALPDLLKLLEKDGVEAFWDKQSTEALHINTLPKNIKFQRVDFIVRW